MKQVIQKTQLLPSDSIVDYFLKHSSLVWCDNNLPAFHVVMYTFKCLFITFGGFQLFQSKLQHENSVVNLIIVDGVIIDII